MKVERIIIDVINLSKFFICYVEGVIEQKSNELETQFFSSIIN